MIIYKDILTNDELFTDSNKVRLVEDCLYEVECNYCTRKHGDIQLEGANPSAEDGDLDGGTDEHVESGLDLVLNQKLVKTDFNKDSYKTYLKTYTKSLQDQWKKMELSDEELEERKKKFMQAVKLIMPKLKDTEFYLGESCNPDAMVCLLEYKQKEDGTEQPTMIFFKHGLESEKV